MAFKLFFRSRCNDQIGDLRRQKTTQPAHALDFADLIGNALFELLIELDDLLSSFAQLVQQPRVLDSYDRLSSEILHQRDLLISKWTDFLAVDGDYSD